LEINVNQMVQEMLKPTPLGEQLLGSINFRLLLAPIALVLMGLPAHADIMFTLNDGGSCCSGGQPFATVTLKAIDANTVQVTEDLTPGYVWAVSGAGESLSFNVDKIFTFVPASFSTGFGPGTAPYKASPFSDFSAGVNCTVSAVCGSGTSAQFAGELQFEITNASGLTPSDFTNSSGEYFASDIGIPRVTGGGFTTGNVATNIPGTTTRTGSEVPEPGSIVLFGTILAGIVTGVRKGRSRRGKELA
jgi:hypothetical protein